MKANNTSLTAEFRVPEWVTPDRWASLRSGLGAHPFVREAIMDGDRYTQCAIGVDDASRLHLMVQVADDEADLPPDLNDISIRYADSDCLVVDLAADAALEIFISPIYEAIIRSCLDGRNPVRVISEHLERIRKAFTRAGSEISENKQIGLVGELLVMHHILIPAIGIRAALQWSGPLAERHDFVGNKVHVEVKSTTRSIDQHEISRLDQLRPPAGKRLLLASVQLERTIAGEHSVASLREAILDALGNDGAALDQFEFKIQKMGWHDRLIQSGTLLRFNCPLPRCANNPIPRSLPWLDLRRKGPALV